MFATDPGSRALTKPETSAPNDFWQKNLIGGDFEKRIQRWFLGRNQIQNQKMTTVVSFSLSLLKIRCNSEKLTSQCALTCKKKGNCCLRFWWKTWNRQIWTRPNTKITVPITLLAIQAIQKSNVAENRTCLWKDSLKENHFSFYILTKEIQLEFLGNVQLKQSKKIVQTWSFSWFWLAKVPNQRTKLEKCCWFFFFAEKVVDVWLKNCWNKST